MLLRRPWQFDRHVLHDRYKNRYSFKHNGHKFTLAPLSPKEVYFDRVKLQRSSLGNLGGEAKEKEERKEAIREKNKEKGPMVRENNNKKKTMREVRRMQIEKRVKRKRRVRKMRRVKEL